MKKERLKNILILLILFSFGYFINSIFFQKDSTFSDDFVDDSSIDEVKERPVVTDLNSDSYVRVSEYIPTDADDFSVYEIKDDDWLELTSVSPDTGIETGFPEYPLLKWQTYEILEKKGRTSINMKYPYFLGNKNSWRLANLNKYIETYIQSIIARDRKILEEILIKYPNDDSFGSTISLNSIYRIIDVKNGIVSLELVETSFTGGGNGNHSKPFTINWDLKSDKLLTADQVFCSENYQEEVLPVLQKLLFERLYSGFYPKGKLPEPDNWNTPKSYDWEYFLLKKDGIVAVFPPYEVSSGASGIVRVFIPNSDIPNFLCLP